MKSTLNIRRFIFAVAMVTAAPAVTTVPSAHADPQTGARPDDKAICAWAVGRTERRYDLPGQILSAISLAETGRWDRRRKERFAWPWTVTSGGPGKYYPNKEAAITAVRQLQRRGVKNIDVGCMQVNLQHHPDAFNNLEQAFNPVENAEYAATFLTQLYKSTRSWARAVATYHSGQEDRGRKYWRKVSSLWDGQRRMAYRSAQRDMLRVFRRNQMTRTTSRLGFSNTMFFGGAPVYSEDLPHLEIANEQIGG